MRWVNCILLLFPFIILSCGQPKDVSMSFHGENVIASIPSISAGEWNSMKGEIYIDTLNLYKGRKTLRLVSSEQNKTMGIYTWYAYDLTEIEGAILSVKGKYKIRKAKDAEIRFKIQQYYHTGNVDSIVIESPENPKWRNFVINVKIDKESEWAALYIIGEGDIDLLLADCEAYVDGFPMSDLIDRKFSAEEDTMYDKGSNIELGELTLLQMENLEVLGKVWGFLKYYHPEITQGKYNWDYELFRVLHPIVNAKDKVQRSNLLNEWIHKYGEIKHTNDYTITDSTKYSRFIDLSWFENKDFFDEHLEIKFQNIKNSKRDRKLNYYISSHALSSDFPFFKRENSYKNIKWDDQGFRILTLFRIWNAIEYSFPYTHYTDMEWGTLLKDFLPKFVSPEDQTSYELAIVELSAKINDSHGSIYIPNHKLHETALAPMYRRNRVPVELIQSKEGYIVVKSSSSDFLSRGDIIVSIEGKSVDSIIEEMTPYIIASNRNGLIRNILPCLLSSQEDQMQIEIIRNSKKIKIHIKHFKQNGQAKGLRSWREYNLDNRDIIHVDNIKSAEENRDIVQNNMNSEGLIIDMRQYPHDQNMKFLPSLILSKYPLWFSENDKSYPGNYRVKLGYDKTNESEKVPNYKGKIVILVDENTQSAGESLTMQHRLAPNSFILGRQTAGANGNVCRIPIPGGGFFTYTWNGAYYPNWEILQREGVKIDIPVSPTIDDIKAGRDVWIEKAIKIIENK